MYCIIYPDLLSPSALYTCIGTVFWLLQWITSWPKRAQRPTQHSMSNTITSNLEKQGSIGKQSPHTLSLLLLPPSLLLPSLMADLLSSILLSMSCSDALSFFFSSCLSLSLSLSNCNNNDIIVIHNMYFLDKQLDATDFLKHFYSQWKGLAEKVGELGMWQTQG